MANPYQDYSQPTVNLNTYEEPAPSVVNLNTDSSMSNVPSITTAQNRARKYMFSMPGLSIPYEQLIQNLADGQEDSIRNFAASKIREDKLNKATEAAMEVARRKGGPLTPEEADYIKSLAMDSTDSNPNTVFEFAYGKEYTKFADLAFPTLESVTRQATAEFPEVMEKVKVEALNITTKTEIAKRYHQDAQQALENQGWVGWTADMAKRFVLGYTSVKLRGNAPDVGFFEGGFRGDNITKQVDALLRIKDPAQFEATLKTITDKLKNDNPSIAVEFTKALVDRSTSDELVDNLDEIVDLALGPVGFNIRGAKAAKAATKITAEQKEMVQQATGAIKDVVKSNKGTEVNKAAAQEASGDVGQAAVTRAVKNLDEDLTVEMKSTNRLIEPLLSGFRTDVTDLKNNTGRLSRELLVRIENAYGRTQEGLMDIIKLGARVDRLPELNDREVALKILKTKLTQDYPGMDNSILDAGIRLVNGTNTREYVFDFGKPGAELFSSWTQANNWAKANGLQGYRIEREGNGFFPRVITPFDETAPEVRKLIGTTVDTEIPDNYLKAWLDNLRTPEETLSKAEREQRKIATVGTNPYMKLIQDTTSDIKKLARQNPLFKKQHWQDWERMLKFARTAPDPETGDPGYFFRYVSEIDDFYHRNFQRVPTDVEIEAYFGYKRAYEIDRFLRNLASVRNMERLGIQKITLSTIDDTGKVVAGPSFNGKVSKDLPFTDSAFVVMGDKAGQEQIKQFSSKTKAFKEWQDKVKNGEYNAYEIFDRGARPLAGFGKIDVERVAYVLTKNASVAPIDAEQIPRRGGGHWAYDYDFYLKQAKVITERVGKNIKQWYEGDTTLMPVAVQAMGQDAAKHLNNIRELLVKKDINGARAYTQKHSFLDFDEIQNWFKKRVAPDGTVQPALLNLKEPIRLVRRGQSIIDLDDTLKNRHPFLKNGENDGLARTNTVEFSGERNSYELQTIAREGTQDNPVYKFAPAKYIDPIPTMDRALTRIVNSTFMDDYKIMSIEHWLKKAEPYLETISGNVWDAPFYHFYHPVFKSGISPEELGQLNAMKAQMEQFIGTPSKTDTLLYSAASRMSDWVYAKTGKTEVNLPFSNAKIAPEWLLPKLSDPFAFVRAVTFHSAIGLFSIPQLFVQLNTFTNILAVAGIRHTTNGTSAAMMAGWLKLNRNPKMVDHLDEKLSRFRLPGTEGWKRGEFREAFEALERSGFGNIAGEYALRDSVHTPQIFKSRGKDFLDFGAMFFTLGERAVRYGAWFTAYKEFRDVKAFGRLTQQDVRQILNRADDLSVNMTRASNSRLHRGVMSVPTQFLTYTLRLAELFWGKRIGETSTERMMTRARMLGWNAALYGVPMSASVTGVPIADSMKEAWIKRTGYTPGFDNYIQTVAMEGIPAMLTALATADWRTGAPEDGNWFNIGERYGVGGFEYVREALRGDKDMWELFGGAAFSKFKGAITATDPLVRAMVSMITDDGESFPLQASDFLGPLKEITTVNSTWRLIAALNTGEYLTKKGQPLGEVTAGEAFTNFVFGLQPSRIAEYQLIQNLAKDQKDLEKYVSDKFVVEFRKGLRNAQDNPQQADEYFRRALAYTKLGGIRPDLMDNLISRGLQGNEALAGSVNWSFFIKNAPDELKEQYLEAYRRRQQQGNR